MNTEQRLRAELHDAPVPADLIVPPDLADAVLRGVRRQRATSRTVLFAAAAATAAAVAVPLALLPTGGTPAARSATQTAAGSTVPAFPALGGGPRTVFVYQVVGPDGAAVSYLLDPATGRYRAMPFDVLLSPDRRRVAVAAGDRVGVAGLADVLRRGRAAVRWTGLPAGNGLGWSPDGSALLITSVTTYSDAIRKLAAHRYDLATGRITNTPVPAGGVGPAVGWAADSTRYLAQVGGPRYSAGAPSAALRYLSPDGTLGAPVGSNGGLVAGAASYSPGGAYFVAEADGLAAGKLGSAEVIDAHTGGVFRLLPPGQHPFAGWYDRWTVVRLVPGPNQPRNALELVDIRTGRVVRTIPLPGVPPLNQTPQLGSSAGLTGPAANLGF